MYVIFAVGKSWRHRMKIRKDVLNMFIPVCTEQLFAMSLGVLNTIIASGIGKEAISAIGTVDSFNNIIIFFLNSLAVGGTVIVAHYTGQRNDYKAKEALKQAVFSSIMIAMAITISVWFFRDAVLISFFGKAEKLVLDYSSIYFGITLFTYPLIAFSFVSSGILRASGNQRKSMKINIIVNFINIIFSYFLIYGIKVENIHVEFSINGMGVKGAAIALTIARISGVILFVHALTGQSFQIDIKSILKFKIDIPMQKAILGVGIPAGLESFIFNIGKLVQQIFIISLGTVSIASNAITWSVFGILIIPGSACSIVATTMVGYFIGKGDHHEAERVNIYLVKLATVLKVVISAVVFPLAGFIAYIYTRDKEVVGLTSELIRINAIAIPLLWPASFIFPSGLKGAGDVKYTMLVSIISLWFFRVLVGYILCTPLRFGIPGLWLAMYMDWIIRGILFYLRLKNGKWKRKSVI
jgi:putative MATE family efflux protein